MMGRKREISLNFVDFPKWRVFLSLKTNSKAQKAMIILECVVHKMCTSAPFHHIVIMIKFSLYSL